MEVVLNNSNLKYGGELRLTCLRQQELRLESSVGEEFQLRLLPANTFRLKVMSFDFDRGEPFFLFVLLEDFSRYGT